MIKKGMIVDVIHDRIFPGTLEIQNGKIQTITYTPNITENTYILPGFIDAHIHIESSMLIPSEFARAVVQHGVIATISDPHEIANVLGIDGVDYMIQNGKKSPFKFHFGAPSCVPATQFETAGATIDANDINTLLNRDDILYLSEMMNYPGVIHNNPDVLKKIAIAQQLGKPIDGHAPGLRGPDLKKYILKGISTDHECFSLDEAREKAELGMKIIIREGSAARNFNALHPIISEYPNQCMFCSDDSHPDQLLKHSINQLVRRAVSLGYPVMDVIKIASLNPIKHYGLSVGLLQKEDPADFIIVDSIKDFNVLETVIDGKTVYSNNKVHINSIPASRPNQFNIKPITSEALSYTVSGKTVQTIIVEDGQLVTQKGTSDKIGTEVDVLKLVVINRYKESPPAIAFVKNMGLRSGAIASSVAHDSHNIVATGCTDADIAAAINGIINTKGGLACVDAQGCCHTLPLPVAGLMSPDPLEVVAKQYENLNNIAKELGSLLEAPLMILSFLALLVIPKLKLSDLGLFDAEAFQFTSPCLKEL